MSDDFIRVTINTYSVYAGDDPRDGPCVRCLSPSSHWTSGEGRLCCRCYVLSGGSPADWHHGCLLAATEIKYSRSLDR